MSGIALCTAASVAQAQTVRGIVADGATAAPLAGVVVSLLDSAGGAVRRGITDQRGEYSIVAPAAGTYRLRAMRIGFRPTVTDPLELILGLNPQPALRLTGIPLALDTVRIASESQCGQQRDETFVTVWEQARAALAAAQLTAATRGLTATVVTYNRTLDPRTRRVRAQAESSSTGFVTQPWRTASVAVLRRDGYVVTHESGETTYHAPGLTALISDEFLVDHCFRVTRSRGGELAVDFEPTRARRGIPEITGTVWLDAASAELRRMRYRYVHLTREQENEAGGELEFARLSDGGWAITRWNIHMPILEQVVLAGRPTLRLREIRVAGGDLATALRGGDTLWTQGVTSIAGTVVDSASGTPLPGALVTVAGTALTVRSAADGSFRIHNVLPGDYTVEVRTPRLDSIGAVQRLPLRIGADDAAAGVRLVVGRPRSRLASLWGTVTDSARHPVVDAAIVLPEFERSTFTDSAGRFRLDSVMPGEHRVVVRRLGFGPFDGYVAFPPEESVERRILLHRVASLDTVTVTARSLIPSFDEHRAQQLGRFFTREELDKQRGRRTSEVLAQVQGVRLLQSDSDRAFIATRRRGTASTVTRSAPSLGQGPVTTMEEGWCYATVYLNGARVYETDSRNPPFDINSIAVDQIEAIEYYASQTQVPMRYSRGNVNCGVVVIHTRRVVPQPRP